MTLTFFLCCLALQDGAPWPRHTIDGSSKGADGVKLADVDRDGRPDIVTGWEQGGVVRVYLHPGTQNVRSLWPAVTVAKAGSVEDAVFADLDGDGALDVIASCEGSTRSVIVSWGPREKEKLLDPAAWKAEPVPALLGVAQWMFAIPLQVDGKHGVDLVVGGKNKDGQIGWLEAPAEPRRLGDWKWHKLRDAGWVMSLFAVDMDGDKDLDIVFSDRKGKRTGCFWLENPAWTEHAIGAQGREAMFMALGDFDRDGLQDAAVAAMPKEILLFRRASADGRSWETRALGAPERAGQAKAVAIGDIDLDGKPDFVFSSEGAKADRSGVLWLTAAGAARDISGPAGVKFDLIELLDLDGDGDLDVLTCEEIENLGVFWYENPAKP